MQTIPHLKLVQNDQNEEIPVPKASGNNSGDNWLSKLSDGERFFCYPKNTPSVFLHEFTVINRTDKSILLWDMLQDKDVWVRPFHFSQTFDLWEIIEVREKEK